MTNENDDKLFHENVAVKDEETKDPCVLDSVIKTL